MKKTVLFTTLIFAISFFLPACLLEGGGGVIDRFASEDERRRDSGSNSEQDLCKYDDECEEICEEVYDESRDEENDGNVDACVELRYDRVIQFEYIMDALEDPFESKLKNIDDDDFFEFLEISVEPWVRSTKESVSNSEAEALLVWVAREDDISNALTRAYQNYEKDFDKFEGVTNLFEEIAPHFTTCSDDNKDCAEIFHAITEVAIVGSQSSFQDIVKDTSSFSGQTIYCEVFNQKCGDIIGEPRCSEADLTNYQDLYNECI